MRQKIRIVNYAVNGSGVGHVARLVSVSRWMRRYTSHLGVRAEIYFLTSSEASGLLFAERFASFKLPSKTMIEEGDIDDAAFLIMANRWVRETLALLSPDILVVDTFPRGYYDELPAALDACRRRAFIYRPMKKGHAERPEFQDMLSSYDLILVPESAATASVQVPEADRPKLKYIGPLVAREHAELLDREEARRQLGVSTKRLVVYASFGGGGDPCAEGQISTIYEALRDDATIHLVIGAGPLYRGRPIHGERVTWLSQSAVVEFMNAFDLAFSAAGYNSFNELMYVGVPSVFMPQEKWADDQRARAERAVSAGAGVLLETVDAKAKIREVIEGWRDPLKRSQVAEAARSLARRNHARDAAREILKLALSPAEVEAAGEVSDELIAHAR